MSEAAVDRHEVRVSENPDAKRFEARIGDELAGIIEYIPLPDRLIMTHTQVKPKFEGQGVGGRLVAGALDTLRADGRRVQPQCPYVASFIRKHPDYRDVVAQ